MPIRKNSVNLRLIQFQLYGKRLQQNKSSISREEED